MKSLALLAVIAVTAYVSYNYGPQDVKNWMHSLQTTVNVFIFETAPHYLEKRLPISSDNIARGKKFYDKSREWFEIAASTLSKIALPSREVFIRWFVSSSTPAKGEAGL